MKNTTPSRILKPHPHDVLSGRGALINMHPGNSFFRELVRVNKEYYQNPRRTRKEKNIIVSQVVQQVVEYGRNPGGRFLERRGYKSDAFWIEMSREQVIKKTKQALREQQSNFEKSSVMSTHNTTKDKAILTNPYAWIVIEGARESSFKDLLNDPDIISLLKDV